MTTTAQPCPMCGATGAEQLSARVHGGKPYHLARCGACGLHFCTPTPTLREIEELYAGDYHSGLRNPGATEATFGPKFARYRDRLLRVVKPGRSMDIGTATGLFPSILKQAGFDAAGVEFNTDSAKWGRERYGVVIHNARLEDTGTAPASLDLVTMTDVLEHTQHPLEFLRSISGFVKPGGHMMITFPDIRAFEALYTFFVARILKRDWIWYCNRIPHHIWEFTPATSRLMFDKAGFDVVDFQRTHIRVAPSPGLMQILMLPLELLRIPFIGNALGAQMEFIIRKRA